MIHIYKVINICTYINTFSLSTYPSKLILYLACCKEQFSKYEQTRYFVKNLSNQKMSLSRAYETSVKIEFSEYHENLSNFKGIKKQ